MCFFQINIEEEWGVARIELAASRTRSENHTTRPNTLSMEDLDHKLSKINLSKTLKKLLKSSNQYTKCYGQHH